MSRSPGTAPLRWTLRLATLGALALPLPAPAQSPPAAAGAVPVDSARLLAAGSRAKGSETAPVTIVELSDFQCPFCREFALTTLPRLDSAYIQTGRARLVFFNLPLPSHPAAWPAAEAALCAGAQGRFWPMHDRLFAQQAEWTDAERPGEHFDRYARELGLEVAAFQSCTQDDWMAPVLTSDLIQAARSGASSTPTFILNGETVLPGARSFEEFQKAIEELLGKR